MCSRWYCFRCSCSRSSIRSICGCTSTTIWPVHVFGFEILIFNCAKRFQTDAPDLASNHSASNHSLGRPPNRLIIILTYGDSWSFNLTTQAGFRSRSACIALGPLSASLGAHSALIPRSFASYPCDSLLIKTLGERKVAHKLWLAINHRRIMESFDFPKSTGTRSLINFNVFNQRKVGLDAGDQNREGN